MIYLAIDPGLVSGVVRWNSEKPDRFESHELDTLAETAKFVNMSRYDMHTRRGLTVVTEKFIISARTIKTKVYYESLYFNGWLSIEYPDRIEQTAAQAKGFATDAKLKHMGWYTPSKDGHANDAARHLMYRAVKDRVPYVIDRLKEYT